MTREQLIALCLQFRNVYEDYPFSKGQSAMVWTTIRHSDNKKIFALVFERDDKLYINLKCEPQYIEELRELKAAVSPGYHMNKSHWNTVMVNGDVSERELAKMIEHSYTLTSQCRLGRRRPGDGAVAAAGRDDNHARCCRSAGNRDKRRKNLELSCKASGCDCEDLPGLTLPICRKC